MSISEAEQRALTIQRAIEAEYSGERCQCEDMPVWRRYAVMHLRHCPLFAALQRIWELDDRIREHNKSGPLGRLGSISRADTWRERFPEEWYEDPKYQKGNTDDPH